MRFGSQHRRQQRRCRGNPSCLRPQGNRIIGQYVDGVAFGQRRAQRRVLLVWNRLILPGGRSIVLERLPGADSSAMPVLRMASITIGGI